MTSMSHHPLKLRPTEWCHLLKSFFSHCVVGPGRVSVWESSSGQSVHNLEGPGESVEWVAWHPRGDVILAGSEDFTAWMWNAQSGEMMQVSCFARIQSPEHHARLFSVRIVQGL